MKKVVYSVTKAGKDKVRITGLGYITNEDLIVATLSKSGKPYVRIFEDCIKNCHPVVNAKNEFNGTHTEIIEIEINTDKNDYETREIEVCYYIWYRLVD